MIDQITFFQRKDHIREASQHVINVKFKQRSDATLVVPTNISYRIDCLTTGAVILDWTSVSADDEVSITITPTQNALQSQCNAYEKRQVTVAADRSLSTQFLDSTEFTLENVRGVT
jgi:hypothetical protein